VLIFDRAELGAETEIELSELLGVRWILESFGQEDALVSVLEGTEIAFEFDAEGGQVSGSAGCNSFFGEFDLNGDQLSFGPLGATRMACEPAIMDQETSFLDALQATESVQIDDGQLKIGNREGQVLIFGAGEAAKTIIESEIVGIIWQWERFIDTAGINDITVPYPPSYRLELHPDGRFDIKADCNLASGSYTLEASSLKLEFGPMTLAECEPVSFYNEYLSRLEHIVTYVYQDDQLSLNMWADGGDLIFRRLHVVNGTILAPDLKEAASVEVRVNNSAGEQVGGSVNYQVDQFPFSFEAPYESSRINPVDTYSLEIAIKDENDKVIYVGSQEYPVITQGNPSYHLELLTEPVSE
jgi:heat shock protein HslJ